MVDKTLLDLIPDAIVICDASGFVRQVNCHFTAMFGYELEEILATPVGIFMPPHRRRVTRFPAEADLADLI